MAGSRSRLLLADLVIIAAYLRLYKSSLKQGYAQEQTIRGRGFSVPLSDVQRRSW
jgi:hypothetical protein